MRRRMDLDKGPRVYTVADSARLLQVNEIKIRREILSGRLPAARLGRIYRIREEDLIDYLDRNQVRAKTEEETESTGRTTRCPEGE